MALAVKTFVGYRGNNALRNIRLLLHRFTFLGESLILYLNQSRFLISSQISSPILYASSADFWAYGSTSGTIAATRGVSLTAISTISGTLPAPWYFTVIFWELTFPAAIFASSSDISGTRLRNVLRISSFDSCK